MNEQMLIQHALKLLVECEYDRKAVTADHLAAKLAVPVVKAGQLLADLRSAGLIRADALLLTDEGRGYALHVLQAHRLYETYLAKKTSVPESAWHTIADKREHELSESDVEKLARELGDPRYDPHGDPIPTSTGEMPLKQGRPLTDHDAGWAGRVVHVEDEPQRMYATIAGAGIAPDTVLRIERKSRDGMDIEVEGCSFFFSNEVAAQISAVDLSPGEEYNRSVERLSGLKAAERAEIVGLSPLCRGLERNRLLDLGVVPGVIVTAEMFHPSGSPVVYQICGACIALRREQAERIRIRKVGP
jgi:DtxR family Mn-dependent transcriptional regulator